MTRFAVTCKYCGALLMVVPRIGDAELTAIRAHLVAAHSRRLRAPPDRVVTILAHVTVRRRRP